MIDTTVMPSSNSVAIFTRGHDPPIFGIFKLVIKAACTLARLNSSQINILPPNVNVLTWLYSLSRRYRHRQLPCIYQILAIAKTTGRPFPMPGLRHRGVHTIAPAIGAPYGRAGNFPSLIFYHDPGPSLAHIIKLASLNANCLVLRVSVHFPPSYANAMGWCERGFIFDAWELSMEIKFPTKP
jgi:hypothetical protein